MSTRVLFHGEISVALKPARIGRIRESVDATVRWDRFRSLTESGVLVETLATALVCGERSLHRMQEFWSREGFASYLEGLGRPLSWLDDDAYGYGLDRIAAADGQPPVKAVEMNLLAAHDIDIRLVHLDTTSVSVKGAYDEGGPEEGFRLAYGHSKDRCPDLKQIKIGLTMPQGRNIPAGNGAFGHSPTRFGTFRRFVVPARSSKEKAKTISLMAIICLSDQSRVGNSGGNADALTKAPGFDRGFYIQGDGEDGFIRSKSFSGSV